MDTSISMNINSSKASGLALTVAISGLRTNATFGPTAENGVTLNATVSHETNPNPQVSYQWCTQDGPIAGEISPAYTVDADAYDTHLLHCQVTPLDPEDGPMVTSANYVVRYAPVELVQPLDDMIFDLGAGVQEIDIANVFTGDGLSYTASGTSAAYNAALGHLEIETDAAVIGSEITLTAMNSGGTASTTFLITIEEDQIEDVTYYIPAFTTEGDNAVPVSGSSIQSGDPLGHWQIIDQMLSPSATGDAADLDQSPYTLILDDSQEVTLEITQQIGETQWALSGPRADGFDLVVFEVPVGVEELQISLNNSPFVDLGGNTPGTYFIGGLETETAYRVALRGFAGAGGPPSLKSIFTIPADPRGFRGWNAGLNLGTGGDLFVAPYGDDSNDGLSATTPFQTIGAANAAASSGDVIKIRAGVYRELVEPNDGIGLEGYGTEKPILTAAEPLMGFVRCDGTDSDVLGANHVHPANTPCPIFKTTLNKADIEHGQVLALNIFDGGDRMFPSTDRADVSNLFDDLNQKTFHKATSLGLNADDRVISITDPNTFTDTRYTAAQLMAADVLLYHFPNVVSRVKITSVDLANNTVFVDGLKRVQVNGTDVDTYALSNVGPALTRGTYYIEEHDTSVDIYIYPLNADQTDLIEYSSRTNVVKLPQGHNDISLRGLQVTRASGWATTGGINIYKADIDTKSTGHVVEHVLSTDVYNSTKKGWSIRLNFTGDCRIESCSFYNLMNGVGVFLNGGRLVKDGNQVITDRNPGTNNMVSRCHFEKIAGSAVTFYHQYQVVMAHSYIRSANTAAHANKTNAYEQSHNVMWWGNEFDRKVQAYLTWQEASAVTVAWNVIPVFWPEFSDRRAIADQANATPAPVLNSLGYLFNNAITPQVDTTKGGVAVNLANSSSDVSMTVVNNVLDSVTAPPRANPPYVQFASNIVTYMGYDGANQTLVDFPPSNVVNTDLTSVYADPANHDFSPASNGPTLILPGQDTTAIIAQLQATYPFFTGFDRDYKDQLIDHAMLPIGPDSAAPFERIPTLSAPQASVLSPTSASGAVTTSLPGGTLYAGLWSDTLPPTESDLIGGIGASFHDIVSSPDSGARAFTATDLTEGATLVWHFLHVTLQGSGAISGEAITLSQGASGVNLMPDPGFDDTSKWSLFNGYDLSAGTLAIGPAAANFSTVSTSPNHTVPVMAQTTYEIALDVVAVTTPDRLRIMVQNLSAGAGLGTAIAFDTQTSGPLVAGARIAFQITTQAGADAIKISFNKLADLEAVFDNISCVEIS